MSDLLAAALSYADSGWLVFPCQPRTKIPATPHGFKDATRDRAQITAWWSQCPDYNVAIATGELSDLFVLDIDEKPGRTIDEAIASLPEIPTAPTVRTGGGGLQFFLRFPKGHDISISGGRLGLGIDTRGNGGYVVAPPSLHPHGTTYQWIDSDELTGMPACPDWIVQKLEKQKSAAVLLAGEKLSGGRHDTLMTAAALMRGIGLVPAEILAALQQMVGRLDLSDGRTIPPDELTRIANWCGDKSMGLVNVESVSHGDQVAKNLLKGFGSAAAEISNDKEQTDPGPFPDELLEVPGIITQWCDYINRTSFRKQPVLALAAALTACGALIGRRLETESRGRANLYCLGICETGGGKDSARTGIKEVLVAAGADALIGPEDFASESGLVSSLVAQPVQLCQVDEIGKLLEAMGNDRAPPHMKSIVSALLKLYSSAATVYKGKAYSDSAKNPVINQPHLCLYGTAVPDQTWAALGATSVDDGFMARLWVFIVNNHKPVRQKLERVRPPIELVDQIRTWWLNGSASKLAQANPSPVVVAKTPDAEAVLNDLMDECDEIERQMGSNPLRKVWTRCGQKAEQLALVYAWSRSPGSPVIDLQAALWAAKLAQHLTRSMIFHAGRHLAANGTESVLKRVLRMIDDAGVDGISRNDLSRRTQWLTRRQREDTIDSLGESGQVISSWLTGRTKPTQQFYTIKHAPVEQEATP